MMDADHGGSVTLREINRVMMGESVRYVKIQFSHPDTGIIWALDTDKCVVVGSMEPFSLASQEPILVENMRLVRINDTAIPIKNANSLRLVYQTLVQLKNSEVEFEFLEPIIILNKFNFMLDVEVENRAFAVTLPLGAVYNLDLFSEQISACLQREHRALGFINVGFVPRQRQIFFECKRFPFRLMFASGPNATFSCKYALGFGDEDTAGGYRHMGRPLVIDINLGLSYS